MASRITLTNDLQPSDPENIDLDYVVMDDILDICITNLKLYHNSLNDLKLISEPTNLQFKFTKYLFYQEVS